MLLIDPTYVRGMFANGDINLASEFIRSHFLANGKECEIRYTLGDTKADATAIAEHDVIAFSLFYDYSYQYMLKLWSALDGKKVIIGGPFAAYIQWLDLPNGVVPEVIIGFGESLITPGFDPNNRVLSLSPQCIDLHAGGDEILVSYPLSYGCYWKRCRFCDSEFHNPSMIFVDIDLVLDHVAHVEAAIGRKPYVRFTGECLTKQQVDTLIDRLSGSDTKWQTYVRADGLFDRDDVADKMAEAGCSRVRIGAEIFSDRALALVDKGYTTERLSRVIERFYDAGIEVRLSMMSHIPGTTKDMLEEALHNAERVVNKVAQILVAKTQVYKSSHWYQQGLDRFAMRQTTDYGYWVEVDSTHMPQAEFDQIHGWYIDELDAMQNQQDGVLSSDQFRAPKELK